LESNGNDFEGDWNSKRRPVEDDLTIGDHPSNSIDRLSSSDVFGQPVFVIDDGKSETENKKEYKSNLDQSF
jgi:hypothetical protein